jgi:subtilisin family serine protease
MTDKTPDRTMGSSGRAGVIAGFLAILAGSTFLTLADIRPARAQFGISIGGFGVGGGGFRGGSRPRMGVPNRMPGAGRMPSMNRMPSMRGPMGGGAISRGGMIGPGRGMGITRGPRIDGFPMRGSGRITDGGVVGNGRPGNGRPGMGRPGMGRPGMGRPGMGRPGMGRPGSVYPGDVATRPPGNRPPGRRPPGGRPPIYIPDPGPVVVVPPRGPFGPPVVVLPPGGGGRRPPGGPPPTGPGGFGPRFVGPALAAPALITAARSANAQDVPGMPPSNERRYVPDEVLFVMRADAPPAAVRNVVRRYGLRLIAETQSELVGTIVHRYRVPNRLTVPAAIRAMTRSTGVAYVQPNYIFDRPNYVFRLQSASATAAGGASLQYVVDTLRLPEAHQLARGEQVPIAVIDSGIEAGHPEMAGRVAKSFDAVGGAFQPHEHGTGMAGAIFAHAQLTGISPRASILAARAFAPGQAAGAQGTSFHILRAMDWSIREGARVINMSFAGPRDPMMTRAIQTASGQRIVMIAAMGNEGPNAPVSFPAADPNVIAVTATDQQGRLFDAASRGNHVSVAAPGVEILLPAPRGGYQISSGTSVAAAHVSGIAALLLERQPGLDPMQVREILQQTARAGAARDPQLGAGLADPVPALNAAVPQAPGTAPMVTAPPAVPVPDTAQAPAAPGTDTAQAPRAAPRQATVPPTAVVPQADPSKVEAKD